MSKELITRATFKGHEVAPAWMLISGDKNVGTDLTRLLIPMPDGRTVQVKLDVHDAGELYTALEAHMENVAAPPAPDFRESNLKAFREEIDNLLFVIKRRKLPDSLRAGVDAEFLAAMEAVLEAWVALAPGDDQEGVRRHYPGLAAALDTLATFNA